MDHAFHRRRDQDVALILQRAQAVFPVIAADKALDAPGCADMAAQRVDVDALGVADRAVAFDHAGDQGLVLGRQELGRVIAHIAQALHDHPLARKPAFQAGPFHHVVMAKELAQRVLHAAARGLDPAVDAARMARLAGDAGLCVDVVGMQPLVGIGHPGHLAFARAHVGGGHVLAGRDQVPARQFIGEAAGDAFQLVLVPGAGVDAQPPLGAAEGHLDQRAFVGHQRGQRLDLVLGHVQRIADAALDRLHVFGVDRAIAGKGMDLPAQPYAETHRIGRIADPDLFLQARLKVHQAGGMGKHPLD